MPPTETCPLTTKQILSPADKIYFSCKHFYHVDILKYVKIGTFKCCVIGCPRGKQIAKRIDPPKETRVFDVETEDFVPEEINDNDVEPKKTKRPTKPRKDSITVQKARRFYGDPLPRACRRCGYPYKGYHPDRMCNVEKLQRDIDDDKIILVRDPKGRKRKRDN